MIGSTGNMSRSKTINFTQSYKNISCGEQWQSTSWKDTSYRRSRREEEEKEEVLVDVIKQNQLKLSGNKHWLKNK